MILVIDNYDSFTYNLVQYLGQCRAEVEVRRNDQVTVDEIVAWQPDGVLLSPGPCTPNESGVCLDILEAAFGESSPFLDVPIFGVCLGMEAMGDVAGAAIRKARTIMHGKSSLIQHDGKGCFRDAANPLSIVRYHSLVVDETNLPDWLEVTARSLDDDEVMAIRHTSRPIEGVQFHPESIGTQGGFQMVENYVNQVAQFKARRAG